MFHSICCSCTQNQANILPISYICVITIQHPNIWRAEKYNNNWKILYSKLLWTNTVIVDKVLFKQFLFFHRFHASFGLINEEKKASRCWISRFPIGLNGSCTFNIEHFCVLIVAIETASIKTIVKKHSRNIWFN